MIHGCRGGESADDKFKKTKKSTMQFSNKSGQNSHCFGKKKTK